MSITAERLEVDVTADTSSASRELDAFSRRTDATAKSAGTAGGAAGVMGKRFSAAATLVKAAAGAMAASLAGKTIMAASDLNEVISKTGVVFGPQAQQVTDAAQKMADQFGISKAVYLDAASGIGLIGKAAGLTQKDAAGLSNNFAQLAADASSFYDVPITEALDAMKSGLVGESEPMRRFGVLLNEAAVQNEAYRLGLAKTGAELTEGQKVQARSSLIMRGMTDASGDLARTQSSVANRLREMQGRLTNFAADMGTKALPAAEWFLGAMLKVPGVVSGAATSVSDYVTTNSTFKPVLGAAKAAVDALVAGIKAVPGVFATVKAAISGFIQENQWVKVVLDQAAVAVAAFVAAFLTVMAVGKVVAVIKVVTVAVRGLFLAMAANPIGLVIASLVALGVALYAAYQRFAGFRAVVNTVANALRTAFVAAITFVQQKWQAWGPTIMTVLNAVKAGIMAFIRFMLPVWRATFQAVLRVTKAVWGVIKGVVQGALQVIKGVVNVVMGVIRGDWSRVWKGLQQIVTGAWGVIKSLVVGGLNVLKSVILGGLGVIKAAWSSAWNALKSLLANVWSGIKSGVQNGISAVMGFVRGLPGQITGVFSGAGDMLLGAGKAIISGLLDGIESMIGAVKDKLASVTNMIPDWKGPYEKDLRLLRKNGRAIMKGLVKGFDQELPQVKRYLKRITEWVRAGFGGKTEDRLIRQIKSTQARVRKAMEREDSLNQRLRDKIAVRNARREQKADLIQSMAQGISSQANVLNAGNNATTIRESLTAQVAKAKAFVANLNKMRTMGYTKAVIAQVASAGIETGAEVAAALASANLDDMRGINQAFTEINKIAKAESKAMGGALYNSGIQAANGVVKGLQQKRKAIEDLFLKIARGMENALREALGMKAKGKGDRKGGGKGDGKRSRTSRLVSDALDPSNRPPGRPGGGSGGMTPASTGGRQARALHLEFKTYNPVAEPQSRTTNKALDRVANLGLV